MHFTDLIAAAERRGDELHFPAPENWKQGRTLYGGLTAAMSLHAARVLTGEIRQLRSALVSFAGPSSDEVSATAELIRSGRTAATVRTALQSGDSAATQTLLSFSDLRDSDIRHDAAPAPANETPTDAQILRFSDVGGPTFGENFDVAMIGGSIPMSGSDNPELLWWARHRDPAARGSELGLMCLADILAPAVLTMLRKPAPVSSMTWMVDIISDSLETEDGWYLFNAKADSARGGYSTQDMSVWNSAGELLIKGRQTVTLFA